MQGRRSGKAADTIHVSSSDEDEPVAQDDGAGNELLDKLQDPEVGVEVVFENKDGTLFHLNNPNRPANLASVEMDRLRIATGETRMSLSFFSSGAKHPLKVIKTIGEDAVLMTLKELFHRNGLTVMLVGSTPEKSATALPATSMPPSGSKAHTPSKIAVASAVAATIAAGLAGTSYAGVSQTQKKGSKSEKSGTALPSNPASTPASKPLETGARLSQTQNTDSKKRKIAELEAELQAQFKAEIMAEHKAELDVLRAQHKAALDGLRDELKVLKDEIKHIRSLIKK